MRKGYFFLVLVVVAGAFFVPKIGFTPLGIAPISGDAELIIMENCGGCVQPEEEASKLTDLLKDEIEEELFSAEERPGFTLFADVSGVVMDHLGSPVPGAEVVLFASEENTKKVFEIREKAGNDGSYLLSAYTKDPSIVGEQYSLNYYTNTHDTLGLRVTEKQVPVQYGYGPLNLPYGSAKEDMRVDADVVERQVNIYNELVLREGIDVELDSHYQGLEYPEGMIIAQGIGNIPENLMPAAKRLDWVFKKEIKYSGDAVGGIYFINRSIYVGMDTDPYVALHEFGHHIQFLIMMEPCIATGKRGGIKEEHDRLFTKNRVSEHTFCCEDNLEEEFTNLFASYIVYGPGPMYRLAGGSQIKHDKVRFMERYIFNDVAFECG
jgi:hypothetical protein